MRTIVIVTMVALQSLTVAVQAAAPVPPVADTPSADSQQRACDRKCRSCTREVCVRTGKVRKVKRSKAHVPASVAGPK